MDVAMLDRAMKTTYGVVTGITRDEFGSETPCPEWNVRDLLNHVIATFEAIAAGAEGQVLDRTATDYTADDHVAAYEAATARALEALSAPGAMGKTFAMPWGESPGQMVLGMTIADTAVHGWDLARATGQEYTADDDVAEAVYGMTKGMMEPQGMFPRGTSFGPPVEVPPDASIQDKMVTYLGRRP